MFLFLRLLTLYNLNFVEHLLNIAKECIASIPMPLLNGCIKDLIFATKTLSSGDLSFLFEVNLYGNVCF